MTIVAVVAGEVVIVRGVTVAVMVAEAGVMLAQGSKLPLRKSGWLR